jgi:hypothetical protein
VDASFTTLRWSWREALLLSEVSDVSHSGGSSFTIEHEAQATRLSLPLACRSSAEAEAWVAVLKALQGLDGLDASQRARLRTAFFRASDGTPTLTRAQQATFFAQLNWLPAPGDAHGPGALVELHDDTGTPALGRLHLDWNMALAAYARKARHHNLIDEIWKGCDAESEPPLEHT